MTEHLLLVAIGPVQDFIAQARRSRDLWFGSHVLAEISRAAASSLAQSGATLIFPALDAKDDELAPCNAAFRPSGIAPLSIANKILARVIGDDATTEKMAIAARTAAEARWSDIAEQVRTGCASLVVSGDKAEAAWIEQIDSLLEFSAAWVAISENYNAARANVEQAVSSRKNLRDFGSWRMQRGGVPKSSLDGGRETVLREPPRNKHLTRKYRIGDGEQLDAVGLVKRAGGEPGQFVPIANVALASWLELANLSKPKSLQAVIEAARRVELARVTREIPCAQFFPFDASIFLEGRIWPSFKEQGLLEQKGNTSKAAEAAWRAEALEWGRRNVSLPMGAMHPPSPYVACIVADGDSMGSAIEAIGALTDGGVRGAIERHRNFSARLAEFAEAARKIVEADHLGSLVYSGGDDVLAFVPVSKALDCANELRIDFERRMKQACDEIGPDYKAPTLSVGIGIGHIMEGMGQLLELGRSAEKIAKGGHLTPHDRNALAIVIDKRSGGLRSWRAQWTEYDRINSVPGHQLSGPVARLTTDIGLLSTRRISKRKIYEIGATLRRMPKPLPNGERGPQVDAACAGTLIGEVRRSLGRIDAGDKALTLHEANLELDPLCYANAHGNVARWVDRLVIAAELARATPSVRSPLESEGRQ